MKEKTRQSYQQPLLLRHRVSRVLASKVLSECPLILVWPQNASQLSISRVGTNVILSWPASETNLVLESSAALQNDWKTVSARPVKEDQVLTVTLPMTSSEQFYRLKDEISEKPLTEKDPSEKDPKADTGKESEKDPVSDKDANVDKISESGGKDPNVDKDPGEKDKDFETGGFGP